MSNLFSFMKIIKWPESRVGETQFYSVVKNRRPSSQEFRLISSSNMWRFFFCISSITILLPSINGLYEAQLLAHLRNEVNTLNAIVTLMENHHRHDAWAPPRRDLPLIEKSDNLDYQSKVQAFQDKNSIEIRMPIRFPRIPFRPFRLPKAPKGRIPRKFSNQQGHSATFNDKNFNLEIPGDDKESSNRRNMPLTHPEFNDNVLQAVAKVMNNNLKNRPEVYQHLGKDFDTVPYIQSIGH